MDAQLEYLLHLLSDFTHLEALEMITHLIQTISDSNIVLFFQSSPCLFQIEGFEGVSCTRTVAILSVARMSES